MTVIRYCVILSAWFDGCVLAVILYFCMYPILAYFSKPENIRSPGLHEPTGNCTEMSPVYTVSGKVIKLNPWYTQAYRSVKGTGPATVFVV